ncbi:MAG: rhomboid family intramembrane serine protease [archaeon]|nr:rhomboid family intramembrane serine protease [archaeon]
MERKYISIWIVAITSGAFLLQMNAPITDSFALISSQVAIHPWTLITHMFMHGGATHLLYNMFALALFGTILEVTIGWRKFLVIYFVGGLVAGLAAIPFYNASIGASGAVFAVMGALAVLKPKMIVYVGWIPMPMAVAAAVWAMGDLIGMFAPSGIANAAHLGGLAFGLGYAFLLLKEFHEWGNKNKRHSAEDEWEDSYFDKDEMRWY